MTYLKSNLLFEQLQTEQIFKHIPRPIVIADALTNAENMGSLIRLADNLGAEKLFFLGEQPSRHVMKLRRAAASSRDNINWSFTPEMLLRQLLPVNMKIVALETATNATNVFTTQLPENAAFVVGNERYGMRPEILSQADMIVYIPVPGPTRSLNVSHAAAVLFFEWLRQMQNRFA